MQSVISSKVPANEQGEIQGTLSSLMSASAIVGPPMMTSLFYFFTHKEAPFQFAGAPFILGGILMMVSTIVSFVVLRKKTFAMQE
jgi:DHA1 family tetracycline resistance protein-like MFS transporter